MSKKTILPAVLFLSIFLVACGEKATATSEATAPGFTSTPDLCSTENLPDEAAKVNKLMREFDDYSALASNTPQAQLVTIIPEMQRVLRDAEDQRVPACLENLKKKQIAFMQVVVQTLMAFIGNSDADLVNFGISQARELHTQYDIELARLLGITLVIPAATADPITPQAADITASPTTSSAFTVANPGPSGVNLRNTPDLDAPELGVLAVQATTEAFGKTADNLWILVAIPDKAGEKAWVYATLIKLSVPLDQLPVVTP